MKTAPLEKRKHQRYDVNDFVLAVCGSKFGQVINISEKGLAFKLMYADLEALPDNCITSLLSKSKGFLVEELSLKLVRKEGMTTIPSSTIAAQFTTSDTVQLGNIKKFISGITQA